MDSSIFKLMHNKKPKIESLDYANIVEKYAAKGGVKEKDSTKFFENYWMPFAWAAILGFIYDKSLPLEESNCLQPFNFQTICSGSEEVFYALMLMVVGKEGYDVLKDSSKMTKIIEEHAKGGFALIKTDLEEKGDDLYSDHNNFIKEIVDRQSLSES